MMRLDKSSKPIDSKTTLCNIDSKKKDDKMFFANTESKDLITKLKLKEINAITYSQSQHFVERDGALLQFIPLERFNTEKRLALYQTAIKSDGTAVEYILQEDWYAINSQLLKQAIRQDTNALLFIPTEKITRSMFDVKKLGRLIEFVPKRLLSKEDWIVAIESNSDSIYEIPDEYLDINIYCKGLRDGKLDIYGDIPPNMQENSRIMEAAIVSKPKLIRFFISSFLEKVGYKDKSWNGRSLSDFIEINTIFRDEIFNQLRTGGEQRNANVFELIALCLLAIRRQLNVCRFIPPAILRHLTERHPDMIKLAFSSTCFDWNSQKNHIYHCERDYERSSNTLYILQELLDPELLARIFSNLELEEVKVIELAKVKNRKKRKNKLLERPLTAKKIEEIRKIKNSNAFKTEKVEYALSYGKIPKEFPPEKNTVEFQIEMTKKHGKSNQWNGKHIQTDDGNDHLIATLKELYAEQYEEKQEEPVDKSTYKSCLEGLKSGLLKLSEIPDKFLTTPLCTIAVLMRPADIFCIPEDKRTRIQNKIACRKIPELLYAKEREESKDQEHHQVQPTKRKKLCKYLLNYLLKRKKHLCYDDDATEMLLDYGRVITGFAYSTYNSYSLIQHQVFSLPPTLQVLSLMLSHRLLCHMYPVNVLPYESRVKRSNRTDALNLIAVLSHPYAYSRMHLNQYTPMLLQLQNHLYQTHIEITKTRKAVFPENSEPYGEAVMAYTDPVSRETIVVETTNFKLNEAEVEARRPIWESESEEELENDGVEVLDDRLLEEKQSDPVNKNSKDQNREFPEVIYLSTQNMKVTQSNTIMRRVKEYLNEHLFWHQDFIDDFTKMVQYSEHENFSHVGGRGLFNQARLNLACLIRELHPGLSPDSLFPCLPLHNLSIVKNQTVHRKVREYLYSPPKYLMTS